MKGSRTQSQSLLVSRLGLVVKAHGWQSEGRRFDSPLRLNFLFKKNVIYGHCLVTLLCTINGTVKRLTSLPILNAEIILVVTV